MSRKLSLVLIFLLGTALMPVLGQGHYLDWGTPLTLPVTSPGIFFGVHNEVAILAGGQDTTQGAKPMIYVGEKDDEGQIQWETKPEWILPEGISHGATVSTLEGIMCVGEGATEVLILSWEPEQEQVEVKTLPELPTALSHLKAAVIGTTVFVLGAEVQNPSNPLFLSLDLALSAPERLWESLPRPHGQSWKMAGLGVQGDAVGKYLYLLGGEGEQAEWRYNPALRLWKPLAGMEVNGIPYYALDAPVIDAGVHHLLVLGAQSGIEKGLNRQEVLAYHTVTNTWAMVDTAPEPLPMTAPATWWEGTIMIPGAGTLTEVTPIPAPSGLRWLDYGVIILYLSILVWMGAHFTRKGRTTQDYFTAGKRIPWWAAGISIFATSLSAITYMSVPAKAYGTDWTFVFLSLSQLLTVPLVIWMVLPFYRRLKITTAYEYLEKRFHVVVRLIGGFAFLLFQFGRIGIVLFLPAIALSVVTGVDIYTCIIVMAVLSIIYTVLGGIEAVIWTDVKQVAILTLGAIVSLVLMTTGVDGGVDTLLDIGSADGKLLLANLDFDFKNPTLWVILGGGIGTNLINQTSDQSFVQRYLTTKDEKSAVRSLLTTPALSLPVSILFFGLGTALYGFYKTHPGELNPVLENADAIFPWYIVSQLPQGLSGLLIAGIFAASMSSLDSSLNSAATVITVDFYKRFIPSKPDPHYLKIARIVTVMIGVVGMGFALLLAGAEIKSLWDEFSKVLGLFAGGLAGLFLLGMSSKRATTGGALIGFGASAVMQYWVSSTGAVHFLLYTLTGLASCYIVGWLASWLFPRKTNLEGLTVDSIRKMKE